ncbi:class 1 fructose-bisphosphatase [Asticcacaulis sp.]|uniref:class 1 fructose-bisphosphatase n=1 Tax=Asticcacaulis sp. TaxID=1872648 RepID=UPI00391AAB49
MPMTLSAFLEGQSDLPQSLKTLIAAMADTCAVIGRTVNLSAVNDLQGALEQENVQGEVQKQLDVIANDIMLEEARWKGVVRGLASEEMDDYVAFDKGDYLLFFDPIDGSSNVDVNGVVGTIFSVLPAPQGDLSLSDFLRPGRDQVAAGYAAYGPQTLLVLTVGKGVVAFTPDADGVWIQTKTAMTVPASTREFAINMSNHRHWFPGIQRYIDECVAGKDGPRGADFNMRWLASMVGDVHRILTRGGIFMYPGDTKRAEGKLRLMYEANPIGFLIEQAGGKATNGTTRILDLQPTGLHQRTGVVLGSAEEVERVAEYLNG